MQKIGQANLAATLANAKVFVQHLDAGTSAALKDLPKIADDLDKALANANQLIVSLNSGYGYDTQFHRDLDRLLVQTTDALNSIRALADLLARHPEALVKGRPEGGLE